MIANTRIIFSDNGTLIDYTHELTNFREHSATLPIIAAEDAIYIGSRLPFNHLYFDIGTQNNQNSNMKVQVWWARAWHDVFDLFDGTKLNSHTLSRDGFICWTPDDWKGWDSWSRNENSNIEIKNLNIFDLYWAKITFTNDLHASTSINYVGHKFSEDLQLYSYYPDLNNQALKTAFATGKTTWDEQHFQAGEEIIAYLNSTGVITTKDQILDFILFEKASIHKVAEIIYFGLGKDYVQHMIRARTKFKEAMELKSLRVDLNSNATLSLCEMSNNVGELYR